jgi:hypothetical protein
LWNTAKQNALETIVRLFLALLGSLGLRTYQWIFDLCVGYSRRIEISTFSEILKRLVHAVFLKTKAEDSFSLDNPAKSNQGRLVGGALRGFSLLIFTFIFLNTFIISAASAQTASQCYDAANVGQVGEVGWTGCGGMLIVDNAALAAVASGEVEVGGNATFAIQGPDGNTYTFANSTYNIFTGQVTSLNRLFSNTSFNGDINYWDVSNVTHASGAFKGSSFNQPLDDWDVSSVTVMGSMR